jgi:hypothetical protein
VAADDAAKLQLQFIVLLRAASLENEMCRPTRLAALVKESKGAFDAEAKSKIMRIVVKQVFIFETALVDNRRNDRDT